MPRLFNGGADVSDRSTSDAPEYEYRVTCDHGQFTYESKDDFETQAAVIRGFCPTASAERRLVVPWEDVS